MFVMMKRLSPATNLHPPNLGTPEELLSLALWGMCPLLGLEHVVRLLEPCEPGLADMGMVGNTQWDSGKCLMMSSGGGRWGLHV